MTAPFFTLRSARRAGRDPDVRVDVAVVGAHLRGQPLHHQLSDRGARFKGQAMTAPCYRLFALDTDPPKPGLLRVESGDPSAGAIEIELWTLDAAGFGSFVASIPAPMAIGRVTLADGRDVAGFLCEPFAVRSATDITRFGGWRLFLASGDVPAEPESRLPMLGR